SWCCCCRSASTPTNRLLPATGTSMRPGRALSPPQCLANSHCDPFRTPSTHRGRRSCAARPSISAPACARCGAPRTPKFSVAGAPAHASSALQEPGCAWVDAARRPADKEGMRKRVFDCIVIGVGGMGAAAVYALARRGRRVLGLEQFAIPHELGSSAGSTRIYRFAYFEDPSYVPLMRLSLVRWQALERDFGEPLLTTTCGPRIRPSS